ncbi:hypothetical protein SARC_13820 [Sphaeroforma arctica JP610]|uniref:Uncharacterized protein n=1 Tax=Sphaeroforma arctica JP610 TaxID=667725 RepID=A0A0L0FC25_9EUKA|nr:hypothetical protein SARC_13820 [Sphaeroforma arctica JP610]KNC73623.1 hypothetical protein SARC_13820 [Sphaeroforma arctica JP610]|eukprot:XP_014147525.1 hypothetical protein SARC_13820 [Sphaeroforma arctica JP610]
MRADPDWLVAYARLYADVWPRYGRRDKTTATANYARALRQDPGKLFEVLLELIVLICGHSMLKVLIGEVEDQKDNPSEPAESAVNYMTAIQKRLAAYCKIRSIKAILTP